MTLITLDNVGSVGLVTGEVDPYALPPNAITSSSNMVFRGDVAKQSYAFKKHVSEFSDQPLFIFPADTGSFTHWIAASTNNAGRFEATYVGTEDHDDLTRLNGSYFGAVGEWSATMAKEVLYLNDEIAPPQAKLYMEDASRFVDLPNWPTGYTCEVFRSFKDVLFALDTTEGGVRYPHRARWSSATDTGAVPATWSEIDASKKAGYFDVNEAPGAIADGRPLGENFLIYKPAGLVRVQFVGGQNQYSKQLVSSTVGAISKNAVVEVNGKHIVFGHDDLYQTDGFSVASIASGRVRKSIFALSKNPSAAFTCIDRNADEVWFCFATGPWYESQRLAYIWNYRADTWSLQDIPNIIFGAYGREQGIDTTARDALLFVSVAPPQIVKKDYSTSLGTATIERTGLFYGPSVRLLNTVYFNGKSSLGVTITLGSEEDRGTGVVWSDPYTVTLGGSAKMDVEKSGRAFAWKISAPAGANLELSSLVFDFADSFEILND